VPLSPRKTYRSAISVRDFGSVIGSCGSAGPNIRAVALVGWLSCGPLSEGGVISTHNQLHLFEPRTHNALRQQALKCQEEGQHW
jgi:hypothetical protein